MPNYDKIHVRNVYNPQDAYTFYPVLIIGAGESGIAMGCNLIRKLGHSQFRIFERQSGIGGAWWINRYPGVACDIPSIFYSYSFAPNYSSPGVFASGSEIVEYLNSVASKYQLADKIECEREITEIRWLEEPEEWELVISHMSPGTGDLSSSGRQHRIKQHGEQSVYLKREKARAKIVVSCVGMLSEPNDWPSDVPGLESFEGSVVHSARWKNDISLAGEDVLVIGAGSSTAQLVPCLLSDKTQVKSVTQVIRDPPWVVPRIEEPGGKEAYARQAPRIFKWCPLLGPFLRACIFCYVELNWFTVLQSKNQKRRSEQEAFALNHMRNLVPGEYHRAMTPTYSYGCKRSVLDQDWLRSMNSPKFQLCTRPLKCVRAREVVLHGSDDYPADLRIPADVIVLGNGFQATKWLHPLRVIGRGGKLLQDIWNERGGPQAYMGTAVDGFPNLFLVGGPNTFLSHTSVIIASENFTKFIIKVAKPVLQGDARFVEARIGAVLRWTGDIHRWLKDTVFTGCSSWYHDERGWNSVLFPGSQLFLIWQCMFPKYEDWTIAYTSKGAAKQRVRKVILALFFGLAAIAATRSKQATAKTLGSLGIRDLAWNQLFPVSTLISGQR